MAESSRDSRKASSQVNLEAEASILGAVLLDESALDRARDVVSPSDFSDERYRRVWVAMLQVRDRGDTVDAVSVFDALRAAGELPKDTISALLIDVAEGTPSAAGVRGYARIVRGLAEVRRVAEVGNKLVAISQEAKQPDEIGAEREHRPPAIRRKSLAAPSVIIIRQMFTGIERFRALCCGGGCRAQQHLGATMTGWKGAEIVAVSSRLFRAREPIAGPVQRRETSVIDRGRPLPRCGAAAEFGTISDSVGGELHSADVGVPSAKREIKGGKRRMAFFAPDGSATGRVGTPLTNGGGVKPSLPMMVRQSGSDSLL